MKKVLNPFRSRNFAAFSSQSYYKTMTRKTIASCKWKFTSQGTYWTSSGPINMSGSSSTFDPRAQCARNKLRNCDVTTWSWVSPQTYIHIDNFPFSPQMWGSLRLWELRGLLAKQASQRRGQSTTVMLWIFNKMMKPLSLDVVWGSLRFTPIISVR